MIKALFGWLSRWTDGEIPNVPGYVSLADRAIYSASLADSSATVGLANQSVYSAALADTSAVVTLADRAIYGAELAERP